MSEWQPIETAPQDGQWFVAACFDYGDPSYEVGRYNPLMRDGFVETEAAGLYRKEQRQVYDWDGFNNMHRMSHWLALPSAPVQP